MTRTSAFGQQVTFCAYVSALAPPSGNPSSSVTFFDGTTAIGQGTLVNGWATLTTSSLAGGHAITAVYSGVYPGSIPTTAPSRSAATSMVVSPDTATTTLASSAAQTVYGQAVRLTAAVAVNAPRTASPDGGVVAFADGGTVIGTATVVNGTSTFTTTALGAGQHNRGVASSAKTAAFGQTVTYSAAVAPGAGMPTGQVRFYDGLTLIGTATLTNGAATLTCRPGGLVAPDHRGLHGRRRQQRERLGRHDQDRGPGEPERDGLPAALRQHPHVPDGRPAGPPRRRDPDRTITYYNNGVKIGQATLVGGSAFIAVPNAGILAQNLRVVYSGDANYAPATVIPQFTIG